MNIKHPITIGVIAKAANVGVETIRFYERKKLIAQPPKLNGFRHYTDDDVRVVKLVKRLQGVGFTLDEIKDFLVFDSCCSESTDVVRQKSLYKIQEINAKIKELTLAVNALETFANTCGSNNSDSNGCDLLDCFENNWVCCDNSAGLLAKRKDIMGDACKCCEENVQASCCCNTEACKCDEVCNCGDCCKEAECC